MLYTAKKNARLNNCAWLSFFSTDKKKLQKIMADNGFVLCFPPPYFRF